MRFCEHIRTCLLSVRVSFYGWLLYLYSICHLLLPCPAFLSTFFFFGDFLNNVQYVAMSLVMKIKTLDSTYLIDYFLISLLFTAKYFYWHIFAFSSYPPLLPEFHPISHLHHCSKTDLGKFTYDFLIAKSHQFMVFILLDLSVWFDIILSLFSLKVFLHLVSTIAALTWLAFHFAG